MKIFMWFFIVLGVGAPFFAYCMDGGAKQLRENLGRLLILEAQVALMQALIDVKEKEVAALAPETCDYMSKNSQDGRLFLAGMYARFALWNLEVIEQAERVRAEANRYYHLPKATTESLKRFL